MPLHVETHRGPATQTEAAKEQEQGYREARAKIWERVIACLAIFIGAVQGLIFWRQLLIFEEQVGATQRQIALVESLERAFLSETLQFSSDFPLGDENRTVTGVTVKNVGRSRATLISVHLELETREKSSPLPPTPNYVRDPVENTKGIVIPANEHRLFLIDPQKLLTDEEKIELRDGDIILYCYGRVEYTDGVGKLRMKQFCQQYHLHKKGEPDFVEGFRVAGPPSYNEAT
jgi:hypothetical protein